MDRLGYISSDVLKLTASWSIVYYSCTVVVHTVQCGGHTVKTVIKIAVIIYNNTSYQSDHLDKVDL